MDVKVLALAGRPRYVWIACVSAWRSVATAPNFATIVLLLMAGSTIQPSSARKAANAGGAADRLLERLERLAEADEDVTDECLGAHQGPRLYGQSLPMLSFSSRKTMSLSSDPSFSTAFEIDVGSRKCGYT